MARQDNTITPGRFRNNLEAVISAILLLAFLTPAGAFAGYRITSKDKTIETSCYWIEKSRVHLCEGGEPLVLSAVSAITPGQFTPLEAEMHKDAMRRFWTCVSWLLDREADLMDRDKASQDTLKEIDDVKSLPQKSQDLKALKKKGAEEIRILVQGVTSLSRSWSALRVLDRSHVRLSEIKNLQMISWDQALEERLIYLQTSDPTYREYTLEHMRQAVDFQESFGRVLKKAAGEE